jgi:sarcosine oxidase subunit gamma
MATMPERHSPLEALAPALEAASSDAVALREVPFLAQVNVRADAPAARALGLPLEPNTTTTSWTPATGVAGGDRTVLWLGPDEWLVVGRDGEAAAIAGELEACPEGWVSIVDLSANRTAIDVAGPAVRDLLAAGCSLDLHPRAFGPGRCAQTMLARAQVILEARGEDCFRVHVRGSFAVYLASWLIDAAAGLAEDDRAVGVDEDAVLEMPPHRP